MRHVLSFVDKNRKEKESRNRSIVLLGKILAHEMENLYASMPRSFINSISVCNFISFIGYQEKIQSLNNNIATLYFYFFIIFSLGTIHII